MFSELTKRDIIDKLILGYRNQEFKYWGRGDETSLLSRIVNIKDLPSNDSRFPDMASDIWQHTINNDDWDDDWFFIDSRINIMHDDEVFKKFLEQIFHPVVIENDSCWIKYLEEINMILRYDSVCLSPVDEMSGRAVYKVVPLETNRLVNEYSNQIKNKFSSAFIDSQVTIMINNIESNPNVAIGKAKELLESCAKSILDEMNVEYDEKMEVMPLMKLVMDKLKLSAKSQNKKTDAGEISSKILGNLSSISQNMASLRNAFGDGHGKSKTFVSLPPRYARLAVGASVTTVYFLWETYEQKKELF